MKYTIRSIALAAFLVIGGFIVGSTFAGGLMETVEVEGATVEKGANVLTCEDRSANGDGFIQLGGENTTSTCE